jgi:fructose-bisphosphate aldolase class 1
MNAAIISNHAFDIKHAVTTVVFLSPGNVSERSKADLSAIKPFPSYAEHIRIEKKAP